MWKVVGKWWLGALTLAISSVSIAVSDATAEIPSVPELPPSAVEAVQSSDPPPRNLHVRDRDGTLRVARFYLEQDNRYLALMPDGRMASILAREASWTDRPFEPVTLEQLKQQLSERFPDFKVSNTKRFIYVHNCSPEFYHGTSRILETMYPALFAYCKRQKIAVTDPEWPLVVVMFRTRRQWQDYNRDLFRGGDNGVVAFYDGLSNWVMMYEQSRLAEVAPELAVKEAVSTVAHEGVHQILHNIGVQQRLSRWPMWIAEGLPEYFAPTETQRGARWKGVGLVNDLRMLSLDGFVNNQGDYAQPGELLQTVVQADNLTSTGYAFAWALTHFLAEKRKDKFYAYLADVSTIGPEADRPRSMAVQNLTLFTRHFGDDFEAMERDLMAHLRTLKSTNPADNLPHYVGLLARPAGLSPSRSYQVSNSQAVIQRWRAQQLARLPADQRDQAKFDVQAFPNRAAALAYAQKWFNAR